MEIKKILLVILLMTNFQGCMLTKVVTIPLRVGGAAVSLVPVIGDITEDTIDTSADIIEFIPI